MLKLKDGGSFANSMRYLRKMTKMNFDHICEQMGQAGVNALADATPVDSGLTAKSWTYDISHKGGTTTIEWSNSNVVEGFNVAIGIQYGHGTRMGGYVRGYDYINPVLKDIYEEFVRIIWEEVTS